MEVALMCETATAAVGQGPHLAEEAGVVRSTRVPAGRQR